jgi:hypothetical protein
LKEAIMERYTSAYRLPDVAALPTGEKARVESDWHAQP